MRPFTSGILISLIVAGCSSGQNDTLAEDQDNPTSHAAEMSSGSTGVHRMNRTEWGNTLHDLLGMDTARMLVMPADLATFGFDNVASGIVTSPLHVELLEGIIDEALDDFFGRNDEFTTEDRIQVENAGASVSHLGGQATASAFVISGNDDALVVTHTAQFDGVFEITVAAENKSVDAVAPSLALYANGGLVGVSEPLSATAGMTDITWQTTLDAGLQAVEVRIDTYDADSELRAALDAMTILGPIDAQTGVSSEYTTVMTCNPDFAEPDECAAEILQGFAFRAWRTPVHEADIVSHLALYQQGLDIGLDWDEAIQVGLKSVLMAPDFSYRMVGSASTGEGHSLDPYELASRLAFFLWSTTPDAALMEAAETGRLVQTEVLEWHITRMLEDSRAQALVDNFVAQWFGARQLDGFTPDAEQYPDFDDELRTSMQTEMLKLGELFLFENRNVQELLTFNEAWIDDRLATHYRLESPGPDGGWAMLEGTPRAGILGTAGWLTAQSHPDQPSAVQRGKWILDNLLCDPVPPPPPEVQAMGEPEPGEGSIRVQQEALRSDAFCQECHSSMDPFGFSMNHFDVIGDIRGLDEIGYPIDSRVELVSGASINSSMELGQVLAEDPRFTSCVVQKVFTYALGRVPSPDDAGSLAAIEADFTSNGMTFNALVRAIITSPVFQTQGVSTTGSAGGE